MVYHFCHAKFFEFFNHFITIFTKITSLSNFYRKFYQIYHGKFFFTISTKFTILSNFYHKNGKFFQIYNCRNMVKW